IWTPHSSWPMTRWRGGTPTGDPCWVSGMSLESGSAPTHSVDGRGLPPSLCLGYHANGFATRDGPAFGTSRSLPCIIHLSVCNQTPERHRSRGVAMADASRRIMIEAAGLSKYYGPFVAIKDITFSIPEGQIVSFLGPNGAGKSTTMKILSGYLAASEGTARIAGFDMTTQRLEGARSLGYLPENGPLYNDMTPLHLRRFFGEARERRRARAKSRMDAVVAQCALESVVEKPIGKLSRGYRQRVGLAQALLHDPAVLIMDEPTAGLDPNQIHDFRDNIRV